MHPDENDRETGARKYAPSPGPEPQDEFSEDCASPRARTATPNDGGEVWPVIPFVAYACR